MHRSSHRFRVGGYAGMEGARAALEYLLPLARHREEVARSHELMEALRAELLAAQRTIEDGAHIREAAARADEAEIMAKARHAENALLTRRAIRWAIWATLVGILGVLLPLLSAWLGLG